MRMLETREGYGVYSTVGADHESRVLTGIAQTFGPLLPHTYLGRYSILLSIKNTSGKKESGGEEKKGGKEQRGRNLGKPKKEGSHSTVSNYYNGKTCATPRSVKAL